MERYTQIPQTGTRKFFSRQAAKHMEINQNSILNLFYRLPQNIVRCFRPVNLLWLGGGIVVTYVCVYGGFDWRYFLFFRDKWFFDFVFHSAATGGFLVPLFVPLILLLIGAVKRNTRLLNVAYAIGQAAIVAVLLAAFFKALTGRPGPPLRILDPEDVSQIFRFGFLRGGVFWGWPSSHTTTAFATAVTAFMLFGKNSRLRWTVILYALYIGFGASISFHWFSDFFMGAILGTIIGMSVGKSFEARI